MKISIKNIVYILLFLGLEAILVVQVTKANTFDVLTIIGYLMLGVIAYAGLLELIYFTKFASILLPEFYLESCKNVCISLEAKKIASSSIKDISSLLKLTVEEFKLLLSIKEEEFHSFVNIKSSATVIKENIEEEVEKMLKSTMIITDSKKLISTSMPEVDYYINFLDVMYDARFSEDIIALMCNFIKLNLEPARLSKILYIIVPYDSNLLFGAGVARILNKKAIKVLKEISDYHLEKHWEGSIDEFNEDNSIIIHDVLYTGRQVIESCKILYRNLYKTEKDDFSNFLFFSLCARKSNDSTKNGIEILKRKGFMVHSILQLDDHYIKKVRSNP